MDAFRTLIATWRPRGNCTARNTSARVPSPSLETIFAPMTTSAGAPIEAAVVDNDSCELIPCRQYAAAVGLHRADVAQLDLEASIRAVRSRAEGCAVRACKGQGVRTLRPFRSSH